MTFEKRKSLGTKGIILKAIKPVNDWIESLGPIQWWIWGGLALVQLIEILGRSYILDKEKVKSGWQSICAFFDKKTSKKIQATLLEKFEKEFINENGEQPLG